MTKNKKIDIVRNILLLFIFFAVCGWIYEVIWTYFDDGVWTNRGFLFGPWLPIYGFGGMLSGFVFLKKKSLQKPWLMALFGFLAVILCVGPLLDSTYVFLMMPEFAFSSLKKSLASGFTVNLNQGLCTSLVMLLLGKPLLEKLNRIKLKCRMSEE